MKFYCSATTHILMALASSMRWLL